MSPASAPAGVAARISSHYQRLGRPVNVTLWRGKFSIRQTLGGFLHTKMLLTREEADEMLAWLDGGHLDRQIEVFERARR